MRSCWGKNDTSSWWQLFDLEWGSSVENVMMMMLCCSSGVNVVCGYLYLMKLLWCARRMFPCLVIVLCLLGRSWFDSQNSSSFGVGFGCFVLFCFYFDSRVGCYVLFLCWLLLAVSFRSASCLCRLSSYFGDSTVPTIFLRL